ncbi:MAG: chloride channel protein [Lachnospiraceae bacterium]|nr:chloride channel protein [Lachnospiraceae bacterium]
MEDKERFQVTEKDQEHEFGKERFKAVSFDLFAFVRSIAMAVLLGIGVGAYACAFAMLINFLTGLRNLHPWLLYLLPVGGLAIVGFYHLLKADDAKGTNRVLESISAEESLPIKMTPLITVGTAITHLFGGSAGREGAALQIGGSIGATFARAVKLDKREVTVMTLCGMSAAFSAMFGTPLTAAVFAMEVVSIGIIHYSAIVPCAVASLTAGFMAKLIGYSSEAYPTVAFPQFSPIEGLKAVGLGILCAALSVVFCIILHKTEHLLKRFLKNPYLRTVVGGALVIGITLLIGTRDFNGAGGEVIMQAIRGSAHWYSFLIKMILTAITLGACYKGGEIVPTIFVGATFGCVIGPLLGIPASVGAALGVCGVFCGVTNCLLASILLCFELFGLEGLPFFLIVAAVSYRLSGYYGLYTGQKIVYSKSRPLFINRTTWK